MYVIDIAETPLENIKKRKPEFASHLLHADFFTLETTFDLILEQTFFCALPPEMRPQYVEKIASILNPRGKLAGLLFDFPLTNEGPPFGGSKEEYINRFAPKFEIKKLERA